MSYVLYFSKPFTLAIALWPFLSLLLTLPVLALLYHRDNRLRFSSALTAYLIVSNARKRGRLLCHPSP